MTETPPEPPRLNCTGEEIPPEVIAPPSCPHGLTPYRMVITACSPALGGPRDWQTLPISTAKLCWRIAIEKARHGDAEYGLAVLYGDGCRRRLDTESYMQAALHRQRTVQAVIDGMLHPAQPQPEPEAEAEPEAEPEAEVEAEAGAEVEAEAGAEMEADPVLEDGLEAEATPEPEAEPDTEPGTDHTDDADEADEQAEVELAAEEVAETEMATAATD